MNSTGLRAHTCWPRWIDMTHPNPMCADCDQPLVRILHGPGHQLAGKPCGFPQTWRHCFIPKARVDAAERDLLAIPEWRVDP